MTYLTGVGWLAACAARLHGHPHHTRTAGAEPQARWALLLETQQLLTVKAICALPVMPNVQYYHTATLCVLYI
jgi:hypothetical protein